MAKYREMSKKLLAALGGKENIDHITYCATRLRILYKNKNLVDFDEIKKLPDISGSITKADSVQVIIGPDVIDAYNEFVECADWNVTNDDGEVAEDIDDVGDDNNEKKNFQYYLVKFSNMVAPIFMPVIPALITGGMILAIKNLLVNYFGVSTDSGTAQWMLNIFDAAFKFLPIYIGYTTAQQLKLQPIMGAMLGAILIAPAFESGLIPDIFGIAVPQISYRSTILPVILGVILLYYVDKALKKVLPKTLAYFAKPIISMLIVSPILLIILAPAGNLLSEYVANFVLWISNNLGFLAIPLLSVIYPYMVMFGLDKGLHPIALELLDKIGYNPITMCIGFVSNICIGATTVALATSMKDKGMKSTALSSGITALCGVTEPAFYGQLISRPKLLIGHAIGAAVSGIFAGLFSLRTFTHMGCPGWLTLLAFVDTNGGFHYVLIGVITAIIGMVVSFVATKLVIKKIGIQ